MNNHQNTIFHQLDGFSSDTNQLGYQLMAQQIYQLLLDKGTLK